MKRFSTLASRRGLPRVAAVVALSAGLLAAGSAPETAKSMGRSTASPNPFAGEKLYVEPGSEARRQAAQWASRRPADAAEMEQLASEPQAKWLGDWSGDIRRAVDREVRAAASAGAMPLLVAYNIPARDCGQHSSGGANGASKYRSWIRGFAKGLGGRKAVVILEPDALAGMDCLDARARSERTSLLREAVQVLGSAGGVVYVDAGNARWVAAEEMASRLRSAGIDRAAGFALNVSNYHSTRESTAYGERISRQVGGKHFVIDTSRNGRGSDGEWCNASGRALGAAPTAATGHRFTDAFLWIKRPGESDGRCNGGPSAGQWWPEYALDLARRA